MANKFREKLADKRSKKGFDEIAQKNHLLQVVELVDKYFYNSFLEQFMHHFLTPSNFVIF